MPYVIGEVCPAAALLFAGGQQLIEQRADRLQADLPSISTPHPPIDASFSAS
jgi:hypothetical protein